MHVIGITKGSDRLELTRTGRTGWGGNSGFHCLNLAVQMRPQKIILVGYDMTVAHGVHWHGPHRGLNNPDARNVVRWRNAVDDAAAPISQMGIRVINCSRISALQNYERMSLEEAMAC